MCRLTQEIKISTKKIDKYKEFCLYFEELNKKGISWGTGDLRRKAKELNLNVPSDTGRR